MFYDHTILHDRKHGVATIWLVATLGTKNNLRKVTRKAIMDVDVPRSCETIADPTAPIALRTQSALLYGVSRVFSQQCGYMLDDMQSLHEKMRGITTLLKDMEVDPRVAATRPEQLNLPIDLGFNIDLDLGFNLRSFDLGDSVSEEPSSLLSPRSFGTSHTSFQEEEGPFFQDDIVAPLNTLSTSGGDFGNVDFDHNLPRRNGGEKIQSIHLQQQGLSVAGEVVIAPDDSVCIHEDGRLELVQLQSHRGMNGIFSDLGTNNNDFDLGLDLGEDVGVIHQDDVAPDFEEDLNFYLGEGPQPHTSDRPYSVVLESPKESSPINTIEETGDQQQNVGTVTVTGVALQRSKPNKLVPADNPAELHNRTLEEWNNQYIDLMNQAHREHASKLSMAQAKRNATYWILDQGIGGVSTDFREDEQDHPLATFSGQNLVEMLDILEVHSTSSKKRSASTISDETENREERRVRSRSEMHQTSAANREQEEVEDFQLLVDGDQPITYNEDEIEPEMGREAQAPLSDDPDAMPWDNYTTSRHNSRHGSIRPPVSAAGVSSSAGGPGIFDFYPSSIGSKRLSRLLQESPLYQRGRLSCVPSHPGSAGPPKLIPLEGNDFDTGGSLGHDLDNSELDLQLGGDMREAAEFELYGPAAAVSTQEAGDAQWISTTLEDEAFNFLSFLATMIGERGTAREVNEQGVTQGRVVTFADLLPPEANSHVVAAQGLLHVLALATKGLIEVFQEYDFGDIEVGIVPGVVDTTLSEVEGMA